MSNAAIDWFNQLGTATDAAMFIADGRLPEAPIVFVNAQFTRCTGLLSDDVLGRSWHLLSISPSLAPHGTPSARDATIVELPDIGADDGGDARRFAVRTVRDGSDTITAYVTESLLIAVTPA